jgi:hypothetical protein
VGPVVKVNELFKPNNKFFAKSLFFDTPLDLCEQDLRNLGLYLITIQDVEQNRGINEENIKLYVEEHRHDFHLPSKSRIKVLRGASDSTSFKIDLAKVVKNAELHRVIVMINGKEDPHSIAIRKDTSGRWRLVDSQDNCFNRTGDVRERLQPAFKTLLEAIQKLVSVYKSQGNSCSVFYPTKESSSLDLVTAETTKMPSEITGLIAAYCEE